MLKVKFMIILITLFILSCTASRLVQVDENIIIPKLIEKPLFIYPHYAQVNNLSGKAHLILKINKSGKVDSVMIEKSSGFDVLDNSAVAFVKQFKYKPAESNGQPIQFYIKQTVDYFLVGNNSLAKKYINQVINLKKKIEKASPESQAELQKELLVVYKDFINSNMDYIGFNQNIREFVNKDSFNRWDESVTEWPMHFIVFDDFIKSYPNSPVNNDARNLMFEYLEKDFNTVKIISNSDNDLLQKREKFDKTISAFLSEEYANVLPDSLNYLIR